MDPLLIYYNPYHSISTFSSDRKEYNGQSHTIIFPILSSNRGYACHRFWWSSERRSTNGIMWIWLVYCLSEGHNIHPLSFTVNGASQWIPEQQKKGKQIRYICLDSSLCQIHGSPIISWHNHHRKSNTTSSSLILGTTVILGPYSNKGYLNVGLHSLWNQHLHCKVWSLLVLIYFTGLSVARPRIGWSRVAHAFTLRTY